MSKDETRSTHVGIGMVIAAGIAARSGAEVQAEEILHACGWTTVAELRENGVDQYDIDQLADVLEHMADKVESRSERATARAAGAVA